MRPSVAPRVSVRVTENFSRNLDEIESFLGAEQATGAFASLVRRLFEEVVPNLERFPELGVSFLSRKPRSVEATALSRRLAAMAGPTTKVREYLIDQYLILYATRKATVYLLAIRHHRQLSFDLEGTWE
ncbi:MAG: type II toxin-antitoxin system RelE/ParE family toxin [Myxococcota bacterium]